MKPQVPVWVALTFLMLLLVLFAALIFMFQGRYVLEDRIGSLQAEGTASAEILTSVELAATAETLARADAEATVAAMGADAEAAQGQIDVLNAAVREAEAQATMAVEAAAQSAAATLEATVHQPPLLTVEGLSAFVQPATDVEIMLSASDPQGIVSLVLTIDGEPVAEIDGGGELLVVEEVVWNSAEEGIYLIEAIATDGDGMTSEPFSSEIEVVDREARLRSLVAEIQAEVEEIRGLEFTQPVTLTLYTEEELRADFEEIFNDDVTEEEARLDVIELYAFDFVEADYDLYGELIELYSTSVLGFYDPDTKELVVVSNDGNLTLSQRLTLVHELNHALQDQIFGLDLSVGEDEERFAFRALVEGESTLMETLYLSLGYMTDDEIAQLFEEFESSDPPDFARFPEVIINSQIFPYTDGATFVRNLYAQGQFERINEVWANPPTTSEQVLNLDLFEAGEAPISIELPVVTDTLGAGWEYVVEDVMGEFFVSEYLDVELSEVNSDRAAAGWGGDRYVVHWNEAQQQVMLLWVTEWDSPAENNQFAEAYINYGTRKYGVDGLAESDGAICWAGEDITCLYQTETGSTVIRAPSRTLIVEIFGLTQP